MTKALYDIDPYNTKFDAVIVSCNKNENGMYEIELDQTGFFPEQGGQTPDLGIIEVQRTTVERPMGDGFQFEVVDVQIQDGDIIHTIKPLIESQIDSESEQIAKLLAPGNNVNGFVDWHHRFSNMQQHSGEHIFSGLVHGFFGYDNVGFHLSDSMVTMDFNGVLSEDEVAELEGRANAVIISNLPINISYLKTDEEKASVEYRSKIDIEGDVRIVTIPDVDVCACCAPHVRKTGEIGILKVMGVQNYKGGVRVSILCGMRALVAFRQNMAIVNKLVNELNVPADDVVENVQRIQQNVNDLKYSLNKYMYEDLLRQAEGISDEEENAYIFTGDVDNKAMRECVNSMMERHTGYCGVFAGNDSNYRFIIGSKTKNCNDVVALLRDKCNAKGGGKPQMVQGSVEASKEEIEDVIR